MMTFIGRKNRYILEYSNSKFYHTLAKQKKKKTKNMISGYMIKEDEGNR